MTEKGKSILRITLLLLAAACIVTGILLGEAETVFKKAVMVCYSCIGIGG